MTSTVPWQQTEHDLERSCQEVEATVCRVAKVVIHASALADRIDPGATADPVAAQQRVRVLRGAAEAGRRTLGGVVAPAARRHPR